MKHLNTGWGFGFMLLGVAAACAPTERALGDEPVAGGGSGGTRNDENAGKGAVLPNGGTGTPKPPSIAGAAGGAGIAGAAGGAGIAGAAGGAGTDCFSPTKRPYLAIESGFTGCACDAAPPECVLTEYEGQPWRVALYCEEGHWVSAEDGVCGDGRQAACRVAGVTYPHGARRIPSPFDCNECECDDGQLICNEAGCPDDDVTCPEGTSLVSRCVACSGGAAMSQCSLVETGCVTEEECPGAACGVACI